MYLEGGGTCFNLYNDVLWTAGWMSSRHKSWAWVSSHVKSNEGKVEQLISGHQLA